MRSMCRVVLVGHLAADVDLRQTKTGRTIASFPVATNRLVRKNETADQKQEVADFHRVIAWQKLAEICDKYLSKGIAVLIEGRLINRSFEDKEGHRHYRAEIIAESLNILTSKKKEIVIEQVTPVEQEETVEEGELVAA